MGDYVQTQSIDFTIPATNLPSAYAAMCLLNTTHDDDKGGGSWGPNGKTEKWFSWMDANYPETCPDAEAIFTALGFEVEVADNGDLTLLGYDSKIGQENLFIDAAGKFANDGWEIVWEGEDDLIWQQTSAGTKDGVVIFN